MITLCTKESDDTFLKYVIVVDNRKAYPYSFFNTFITSFNRGKYGFCRKVLKSDKYSVFLPGELT